MGQSAESDQNRRNLPKKDRASADGTLRTGRVAAILNWYPKWNHN